MICQESLWKQEARSTLGNGFEIDGLQEVPLIQNLKKVSIAERVHPTSM